MSRYPCYPPSRYPCVILLSFPYPLRSLPFISLPVMGRECQAVFNAIALLYNRRNLFARYQIPV